MRLMITVMLLTLEQFYTRMISLVAPEEMLKEFELQRKKEKRPSPWDRLV